MTAVSRVMWGVLALSLSVAIVPACGNNAIEAQVRALGEGCLLDSDCDSDLVCVFRRCHVECETTADCRALEVASICVLGDRPTNVCLLPDELECEASAECPAEMRCARDGACRDACTTDAACVSLQACLKGTCADVASEDLPPDSPLLDDSLGDELDSCRYTSQCFSPLACRSGLCEPECITDRDCTDDAECELREGDVTALTCVPVGPDTPAHCVDDVVSGDESDVDCGGGCVPCASGLACSAAADCSSGVCIAAICQVPNCSDGTQNGNEYGTDCGGVCPAGCPVGTPCADLSDCAAPAICLASTCTSPTCDDGLVDGDETGVDCGGSACAPCGAGALCVTNSDCTSSVCDQGTCIAPACDDGVTNGTETAIDCGGATCGVCGNGAACATGTDCASGSCVGSVCTAPTCSDGVMNGFENAVDCGGGCPNGCPLTTPCSVDADCDTATPAGCFMNVCTAKRTLTVTTSGSGNGTVVSVPTGRINCGTLCTVALFDGEQLALHVFPESGSQLLAFSGDCAGATCNLTVAGADLSVDAAFGP